MSALSDSTAFHELSGIVPVPRQRSVHFQEPQFEERPWGSWHVVDANVGYKIKRIHVRAGGRLSYQTHQYRSEHWVVISGLATCTIDGVTVVAGPGESVDVPMGAKHRLANENCQELVIVEVQRGGYTGEDDIVRLEDDYGRCAVECETADQAP